MNTPLHDDRLQDPQKRRHTASSAAERRADIVFALYYQLGAERSLTTLHLQLRALGVAIGLSTIKRYAVRFRWQERIAALEADESRQRNAQGLKAALAMNERHMQLARAVQGAGGSALQRLIQSDNRLAEMKPGEIARLLELGMKSERDSLGAATTRRDVASAVWDVLTQRVVALFIRINDLPDGDARARAFASGIDDIIDEHLKESESGA